MLDALSRRARYPLTPCSLPSHAGPTSLAPCTISAGPPRSYLHNLYTTFRLRPATLHSYTAHLTALVYQPAACHFVLLPFRLGFSPAVTRQSHVVAFPYLAESRDVVARFLVARLSENNCSEPMVPGCVSSLFGSSGADSTSLARDSGPVPMAASSPLADRCFPGSGTWRRDG